MASLCEVPAVAVILDQPEDDVSGRAIAKSLSSACTPAPTVREVKQTVADAINPDTGHPVSGGDELLIVAGGFAVQKTSSYLLMEKIAPLKHGQVGDTYQIANAGGGPVIASEATSAATAGHDIFALEFMREPTSDSLILNAFGFTGGGTAAAAAFFEQSIASDFASAAKSWYVGEWTDKNADRIPDANELTLIASG